MNKGLYLHFPFCEKKCNYCNFYSLANLTLKESYVEGVIREIKKLSPLNFDTVYFGGGTPSLLDGVELKNVLDAVFTHHKVVKSAEITVEANPLTLSREKKLQELKKAGFNRLSLGVQSFCDRELEALGRGHTAENAINTVTSARTAGFDNISLDLMFAIPHQTPKSFEQTLDTAIALSPEHISVYALSIEDKTVFGVKQKRGENLFLPNEDEEAEMYFLACNKLESAGYEHYEISNFAKASRHSRHNMKYWRGEEYVGIGASAHSYFNGMRYSCPSDIKAFCQEAKTEDCYTNTLQDRAEEKVFLSLRLKEGLDLDSLEASYPVKRGVHFDSEVMELVRSGFCLYDGKTLSLTDKGFFVSNTIILKILDSLQFTP